jgi:cytoskeletal protein CcmA (bactofilin family)
LSIELYPSIKGEETMWKKTENDHSDSAVSSPAVVPQQSVKEQAVIGSSLIVKGDLTGENDLLIQGQVEGKVVLKKNNVTVGRKGRVKADIYGNVITVEGKVQGNLFADERIVVTQSGNVSGNLSSPRVTLEDGAQFKGNIDMEVKASGKPSTSGPSAASASVTPASAPDKEGKKAGDTGEPTIKLT